MRKYLQIRNAIATIALLLSTAACSGGLLGDILGGGREQKLSLIHI